MRSTGPNAQMKGGGMRAVGTTDVVRMRRRGTAGAEHMMAEVMGKSGTAIGGGLVQQQIDQQSLRNGILPS